jgi:mono/diheme cytochrome c family protein
MSRLVPLCLLALAVSVPVGADEPKTADAPAGAVSFMKDVAPLLAQNCIACHNARKAESRYNLTTFAQLAKGGQQGEGITLEPGDPDASYLVELIRPDGQPRMPYKLDPLPPEKIALIERWVKEGARYDGGPPTEDWVTLLHKITPVVIPERYPVAVPITALAFAPDNTAIIGQFGVVKLFQAEPDGAGQAGRDLVESNDSVFAVAFSPDSRLVAAAGADRAIRIWEVESGKPLATIEDHADWVLDLAFSPDGKTLASASRDKTSKVFDVEKKESLVTFPGHAETVYTVGFAPDGKSIATGGGDNQIRIWNPGEEGKQVRTLGGFGGPVFRLQYHPDGKTLIACGADKIVRVFDPNTGSAQRTLSGHADWVYTCALSPDGKTVASGSWDGEVRLWNLADGKPARTIVAAPGFPPGGDAQAAK